MPFWQHIFCYPESLNYLLYNKYSCRNVIQITVLKICNIKKNIYRIKQFQNNLLHCILIFVYNLILINKFIRLNTNKTILKI